MAIFFATDQILNGLVVIRRNNNVSEVEVHTLSCNLQLNEDIFDSGNECSSFDNPIPSYTIYFQRLIMHSFHIFFFVLQRLISSSVVLWYVSGLRAKQS